MAELFEVVKSTISEHLTSIFESNELDKIATVRKFRTVQTEGEKTVTRDLEYYNLDAIISVGYRVNSSKATQFRIWATYTLREYILKGFILDDNRLKQGQAIFGKDYFKELLQRVRSIRASERENTFSMEELSESVNKFLDFNDYKILKGKGNISKIQADKKAIIEYETFNKTQKIISDFDKEIKKLK